jgi:hypothetical protein
MSGIESVGYTEDGKVFYVMSVQINTDVFKATLLLDVILARELAKLTADAADKAEQSAHKGVLQ